MPEDAIVSFDQPLTATLFTAAGKIVTLVDRIDHASATLDLDDRLPADTIAILTRGGVRLFGTLRREDDGDARMAFDDPLPDWQRDRFIGRPAARRPIVIKERLAA